MLPGSVSGTAVDDDDFGGSESLPHQTLDQGVDVSALVEDGRSHAYGWHVGWNSIVVVFIRRNKCTCELLISKARLFRAVDAEPGFFVLCAYTGKEVVG